MVCFNTFNHFNKIKASKMLFTISYVNIVHIISKLKLSRKMFNNWNKVHR
jgi:hypothetical protein